MATGIGHLTIISLAIGASMSVAFASPAEEPPKGRYISDRLFAYGLWGGMTQPYDLGLEGLLRDMQRRAMNCLICAPAVYMSLDSIKTPEARAKDIAQARKIIDLCWRYGVYVSPYIGITYVADRLKEEDAAALRQLAEAFKDHPAVLGWYIRDEPPPDFLIEFQQAKAVLEGIAPHIPAYCNFYRPDSVAVFAPHQALMMTDQYPIAYMHSGTSLGPHFAVREGPLGVTQGAERFNMWGNRGILEWMDLCKSLSGYLPHWIILQDFESGNSHLVRWRQPTIAEMRLQTYMALAGGARGILHFNDAWLRDPYGNPLPNRHGEYTSLWDEVARLGAELTPIGALLIEAQVAEPLTVVTTLRPTPDPGDRVEVRRLRSRTRNVDYLIVFNNDVLARSTAEIHLSKSFLGGRLAFDLHSLEPAKCEEMPGAVVLPVAMEPGGGHIYAVASEADYQSDARMILRGRCQHESGVLDIEYELAQRSKCNLDMVKPLRKSCQERMKAGEFATALRLIRQCTSALKAAIRQNAEFHLVQQDLVYIKRTLGRLGGEPEQFQKRISKAYRGLLGLFWEGQAHSIQAEVGQLRGLVERIETTAVEGPQAQIQLPVEEESLKILEHRAQQYQARE